MSAETGPAPIDPDAEGCLCLVVSFAGAARTIGEVTAEAARRVAMSPVLSDFIEFRFAELGPRPAHGDDRSDAIRRVTEALLDAPVTAGRSYFALVVVDGSAMTAGNVLTGCAISPLLAALRMRYLGICNSDDRPHARADPDGFAPDIVTSPSGIWTRRQDLVDVLRRFAGELQQHFAARYESGLSAAEIEAIRAKYGQPAASEAAAGDSEGATGSQSAAAAATVAATVAATAVAATAVAGTAVAQTAPDPAADLLAEDLRAADLLADGAAEADHPGQADGQGASGRDRETPATAASGTSGDGAPELVPAARAAVPSPAEADEAQPGSRRKRWITGLRRKKVQRQDEDPGEAGPKTEALAYLLVLGDLVLGDETLGDEAALNQGRSALLETDKAIAGLPGFAYRTRVLYGDEEGLRGDLRDAGSLTRRDVRRTVASADFAAVLEGIGAWLRRDGVPPPMADSVPSPIADGASPPTADRVPPTADGAPKRTVVVFFALEPPLADTVAAEVFHDLARRVPIIWVLPKNARSLLSEAFTSPPCVRVIPSEEGAAHEVAAVLAGRAI